MIYIYIYHYIYIYIYKQAYFLPHQPIYWTTCSASPGPLGLQTPGTLAPIYIYIYRTSLYREPSNTSGGHDRLLRFFFCQSTDNIRMSLKMVTYPQRAVVVRIVIHNQICQFNLWTNNQICQLWLTIKFVDSKVNHFDNTFFKSQKSLWFLYIPDANHGAGIFTQKFTQNIRPSFVGR